jgi:hypothetical protein
MSPAPAATPDLRYALIVGVGDYQGKTKDTFGGLGDAAVFHRMLLDAGWRPDHIMVLVEEAATQANILSGIDWLVANSQTYGFSLFHYSGHVKQTAMGDEWLWPTDNRKISDHDFAAAMRNLRGAAWIDIAGCEASGFDEGIAAPNRLFTGSSQIHEKSYESPALGHSIWSDLVVNQGLGRDPGMTIQQVVHWAAGEAPQITANQRPYGPQNPYLTGATNLSWRLDNVPGTPRSTARAPAPKKCNDLEKLLGCKPR